MNNKDRIKIFEDTQNKYLADSMLRNSIHETISKQKIYEEGTFTSSLSNVFITTNSAIEAAINKCSENPNDRVAILNFASATNPGGGVREGSAAQEECICRCTTLYPCLNDKRCWDSFYNPRRISGNNLHNNDIIYSPNVIIFKDDKYNSLRYSYSVAIITCAAPNLRDNPSNAYNTEANVLMSVSDTELFNIHFSRAHAILECAKINGVKHLVLGAFGCGAFRNNPEVVARAYKEILKIYAKDFATIEFAVYCSDEEKKNYNIFKRVLKGE